MAVSVGGAWGRGEGVGEAGNSPKRARVLPEAPRMRAPLDAALHPLPPCEGRFSTSWAPQQRHAGAGPDAGQGGGARPPGPGQPRRPAQTAAPQAWRTRASAKGRGAAEPDKGEAPERWGRRWGGRAAGAAPGSCRPHSGWAGTPQNSALCTRTGRPRSEDVVGGRPSPGSASADPNPLGGRGSEPPPADGEGQGAQRGGWRMLCCRCPSCHDLRGLAPRPLEKHPTLCTRLLLCLLPQATP